MERQVYRYNGLILPSRNDTMVRVSALVLWTEGDALAWGLLGRRNRCDCTIHNIFSQRVPCGRYEHDNNMIHPCGARTHNATQKGRSGVYPKACVERRRLLLRIYPLVLNALTIPFISLFWVTCCVSSSYIYSMPSFPSRTARPITSRPLATLDQRKRNE